MADCFFMKWEGPTTMAQVSWRNVFYFEIMKIRSNVHSS